MSLPSEIRNELAAWAVDDLIPSDLRELISQLVKPSPAQAEEWNAAESAAARTAVLNTRLAAARKLAPLHSTWKHKKGGLYQVMGYQIDTDTGRARIRYKRYGGPEYNAPEERGIEFTRPVEEWTEDRFVATREGNPPVYR